jgi:hypothetical protein
VIPAKANISPDTKVMPYAMATARPIARHGMGGFLSVIGRRIRVSPREPLSYRGGGMEVTGSELSSSHETHPAPLSKAAHAREGCVRH